MKKTILYDYPKSSASYRVRIALNLAGIDYKKETINLLEKEQKSKEHLQRNPQGLVPVLEIDGQRFTQSLSIIEYLNQTRNLKLLPEDPTEKAKVTALTYSIAIDLHPVCNLSVMQHATGGQEPKRSQWMQHFIRPALLTFEQQLKNFNQKPYCTGQLIGLADLCLIPQLYNARRWQVDYSDCHRIVSVEQACNTLDAFKQAHPDIL